MAKVARIEQELRSFFGCSTQHQRGELYLGIATLQRDSERLHIESDFLEHSRLSTFRNLLALEGLLEVEAMSDADRSFVIRVLVIVLARPPS